VSASRPRARGPIAALALLALVVCVAVTGCGVAPSPEAVTFVQQREAGAVRAKRAIVEAQDDLAALSRPPTRAQLHRLARSARVARELVNEVRVGLPTFEVAEEEVPIAESEAGVGANELNYALAELVRYARHPSARALARYNAHLGPGREKWNEAVKELWRLSHTSNPPTI